MSRPVQPPAPFAFRETTESLHDSRTSNFPAIEPEDDDAEDCLCSLL